MSPMECWQRCVACAWFGLRNGSTMDCKNLGHVLFMVQPVQPKLQLWKISTSQVWWNSGEFSWLTHHPGSWESLLFSDLYAIQSFSWDPALVVSLQFGVAIPYFGQIKQIYDRTSDRHQECWWSFDTMMLLSIITLSQDQAVYCETNVKYHWWQWCRFRFGFGMKHFVRKESVTALFKICTSLL